MSFLEIACFTSNSMLTAERGGADRIEMCKCMSLGGLTPDTEEFRAIKDKINIPIVVMIRPHARSFVYNNEEFEQMKHDVASFKATGASGFVFGILDCDSCVDFGLNSQLVKLAEPLPCTFHRAFDEVEDLEISLEQIIKCGFKTVLTSGGQANAVLGSVMLSKLIGKAHGRITVMPGGGVRSSNLEALKESTKTEWYHSSAVTDQSEKASEDEVRLLKKILFWSE